MTASSRLAVSPMSAGLGICLGSCTLPHVGDGRSFDRHAFTFRTLVFYLSFGFHSRASFCASAISAGVKS
jgi:hypothetical protein